MRLHDPDSLTHTHCDTQVRILCSALQPLTTSEQRLSNMTWVLFRPVIKSVPHSTNVALEKVSY
jgi:hypothetical protein